MSVKEGIDVSINNGVIDWKSVKAAGVDFAVVKATQGYTLDGKYHLFTDSQFKANITEATKNGIKCGVYHYLTAKTVAEARTEAAYFVKSIAPYKSKVTLFAAVDVEEDKYLPTDKALLTQIVNTFCTAVQAAGYIPAVYTNPNYLKYRLNDVSAWWLWLALWRSKSNVPTDSQYKNLCCWQYGTEKIKGKDIDANIMIKDISAPIDYAAEVCKHYNLSDATRKYIDDYKYASDLWKKLYSEIV